MKDTFITRIAGVSALLSVAAQFGAMGIAISLKVRPGGETTSPTARSSWR